MVTVEQKNYKMLVVNSYPLIAIDHQ